MKLEKKHYIILGIIVTIVVIYFYFKKNKAKEESNFKFPRWLKIGGCRPCIGSTADGCCGGCACKDAV